MSVAACRSETEQSRLARIRVRGGVRLAFAAAGGVTRAMTVAEADGYRVRFPDPARPVSAAASRGQACAAILLNTGGGCAGGDKIAFQVETGQQAAATVTSVAAERIYRSAGPASEISIDLSLSDASRLDWLQQETILYAGARLMRRISVEMAPSARLLLADILVLGRRGSGERMTSGAVDDRWTVRRGGGLVHMEAMRADGALDVLLDRASVAGGAHATGTLLAVGDGVGEHLEAIRAGLSAVGGVEAAASAWNGKLVVRLLSDRSDRVRAALAGAATVLRGEPMPRAWAL